MREVMNFVCEQVIFSLAGHTGLFLTRVQGVIYYYYYYYLAVVTYNQVQPLRINYLATEFLPKLKL